MKPIAIAFFFMMFCFSVSAQEKGKPVDYANPQVGDYIEIHILYDLDGWNRIRPDSYMLMMDVLDSLKRLSNWKFRIESHTDCRASHAYNDTLSQARADSILNFMLRQGFPSWRISAKGMGERMLRAEKCTCELTDPGNRICSEKEHQLNRRTLIRLVEEIKWTGQEPFNLKFPSPGQFRSFPIIQTEGEDNKKDLHSEIAQTIGTMTDAYFTLYVMPEKEYSLFNRRNRKKVLASAHRFKRRSPVPSRVHVEYLSPKKQKFGVKAGYVLQLDSVLNRKKIMDEIGLKGDTNILVTDVEYMPEKEVKFEALQSGGVPINPNNLTKDAYRLYVITTDFPEIIRFYPYDMDKLCKAKQDTIVSEIFKGYIEAMQVQWQIEGRIVEIEYRYVPNLYRPYMYILQSITKPD